MEHQRPNLPKIASQLPGHAVVMADGDPLGVVEDVIVTTDTEEDSNYLVVAVDHSVSSLETDAVIVPDAALLAVTDDEVVVGTSAQWIGQYAATPQSTREPDA